LTNLFDNDDIFHVLRNHVGDYSFWPAHATVPTGWDVVLDAVPRTEAERYVHEHWTTLTVSERVRSHRTDAQQ
jgi:MbtH protein